MSQYINDILSSYRRKRPKRVGRGDSSGTGKTSGRGTKGQSSRAGSGRKLKVWFEGGQTPIHRRLAKNRGFARQSNKPIALTVDVLNAHFTKDEIITLSSLEEKGLLRRSQLKLGAKIIGRGKLVAKIGPEIASSLSRQSLQQENGNNKADLARQTVKK